MKKNISKIILILFVFGISLSFMQNETSFVFAETAEQLEQQISQSQKNLANLEKEARRIQQELSKTGSQKASLKRELAIINGERKSLENNISQTRTKINLLGSEIRKTEKEIKTKNGILVEQSHFLESLLRRINQQESFSILENFLVSDSISFFFKERDKYLNLQSPILKKTNELREFKLNLLSDKAKLEKKQNNLESEKEKYDDQKLIVVSQENKKKNILNKTKNKESEYQKKLKKTKKGIADLDKVIRDYESKLKFILDKNSLPEKGSAVFEWPLPHKNPVKNIYITQRFGKTTSSGVLYSSGSHSGTDFRAAVGTPIYSVADGIVKGTGNTDAGCPGISFGKWILIEHDVGLSTTYGHLSKIKTTKGKRVRKGDLIGYSGNTGHTTGPHLHLTTYATYGNGGKKVVKVIRYPSTTCPGNFISRPSAPTKAYLNSIDYLPRTVRSMFKHPRL